MNVKFYFVKCRKTNSTMQRPAQEVSFKWSHHRISSAESKVRTSRPFYNLSIEKVKWDIRVLNQNVRFACLSQLEKKALPAFALPIIHLVSRLKFTLALFKLPLWAPQYKKQIGNSNYAQLCRGGGGMEGESSKVYLYGQSVSGEHLTGLERIFPGRVLGLIFAGYVPLASQNPYPITVYSVAIL